MGQSDAYKRAERAAAIKAAAVEVFAESGYHAAKVSEIVKRAGVAQGTFYLYFKSKPEIFGEILQDFLRLVHETVASWDVGRLETVEDYRASLVELAHTLIPVIVEHRDLTRIFFNEALVAPEFAQDIEAFYGALTAVMEGFNRTMHRRGLIRAMDFRVLALSTIGMVERNVLAYVVAPGDAIDLDQVQHAAEQLIDHFVYGAAPRG